MGIIKSNAVDRFLAARDPKIRAFLVHGSDTGAVHDCASRIVASVTSSADDPFGVTQLGEDILKDDPGRLADEAQAISMFGGQRVVWLRDSGAASQRALARYVEDPLGDAIVVAEAGNLTKAAATRKLFEASKVASAIPCYADSAEDLHNLVSAMLATHKLKIDIDARNALVALLGDDRGLSRSEIEKLALYCHDSEMVTIEDVLAICGDTSAQSADIMIDAAFEGDASAACNKFLSLTEGNPNPSPILSGLARHVTMLEALRLDVDSGKPASVAVKSARPPIFFKRQASISKQLRLWPLADLQRARKSIYQATLQTRQFPALQSELAERCIMSLARTARLAASR